MQYNNIISNNSSILISKTIDILRFPLAVMVVAIHTYFNEGLKARGNIDIPFSGEFAHKFIHLFSIVLTDCAVPLFLVISGYLYFFKTPHLNKDTYIKKTKQKCKSILLPYLTWNILACLLEPNRFLASSTFEKISGFWSMNLKLGSFAGPWDGPLWFLRDLFVVFLTTPILEYLIRKFSFGAVLLFLIPYYLGLNFIIPGLSLLSFSYFMIGAYIAIYRIDIIYLLNGRLLYYSIPFFILRFTSYDSTVLKDYSTLINHAWTMIQMFLYVYVASVIAKHTNNMNVWKKLASSGFVIFAMHRLFNSKVSALGLMIIDKPSLSGIEAIILYIFTIVITIIVCYVAHIIIQQNKYLSILFEGSRK